MAAIRISPYPSESDAMQKDDLLKAFGVRLKQLRKQKGWTQKELASKAGIRFPQLNKYECGLHTPPAEKLVELAQILGTSVDYLLTGSRAEPIPLRNTRLLERFRAIEDFPAEDQDAVLRLIDAMIIRNRVQGAIQSIQPGQ